MSRDPDPPAFARLPPPRSLTAAVIARLCEEISSGRLAPGAQLPTETRLIETFGVSRTVVREAVAALRAEGLVDARQGAGVFVADNPRRPFRIDPSTLRTVGDVVRLLELRLAVEIESAGLAAERRSKRQLSAIERTLDDFEGSFRARKNAVEADFDFHCRIGEATQNDLFSSFLGYLGSFIIPRRSIRIMAGEDEAAQVYLTGVLREHRAIADAIRIQDRDAARSAMREHLERGRDRYRRLDPEAPAGGCP